MDWLPTRFSIDGCITPFNVYHLINWVLTTSDQVVDINWLLLLLWPAPPSIVLLACVCMHQRSINWQHTNLMTEWYLMAILTFGIYQPPAAQQSWLIMYPVVSACLRVCLCVPVISFVSKISPKLIFGFFCKICNSYWLRTYYSGNDKRLVQITFNMADFKPFSFQSLPVSSYRRYTYALYGCSDSPRGYGPHLWVFL